MWYHACYTHKRTKTKPFGCYWAVTLNQWLVLGHLCVSRVPWVGASKSSWGKTNNLWEAVPCLTGEGVGTWSPTIYYVRHRQLTCTYKHTQYTCMWKDKPFKQKLTMIAKFSKNYLRVELDSNQYIASWNLKARRVRVSI